MSKTIRFSKKEDPIFQIFHRKLSDLLTMIRFIENDKIYW